MAVMVVAHPNPTFTGRVSVEDVGLVFVGGFTGPVDVPTEVQAQLVAEGFTLNATPRTNYGGRYILDSDIDDPNSAVSASLRAAFGRKGERPRYRDIPRPWVMAHRGAGAYLAPENTLEATDLGIALGLPIVEGGDWWLSTDGTLICMHDGTVDRTTTATGNTADLTAAARDALVIDAGSWFGGGWGNLKVPTWEQMMSRAEQRVLAIEPKNPGAAQVMADYIEGHGLQESVLPNSFSLADLQPFAEVGCAVGYNGSSSMPSAGTISALQALKTAGAPAVSIGVNPGIGTANIQALQAAGLEVSAGTLNRHHQLTEFTGLDLVGYVSDDPVYFQAFVDSSLGLFGRERERGAVRQRRDRFALQTYYHGQQSYTNDLNGRGVFVAGGRWQSSPKVSFTLHGEFWPLPDEFQLRIRCRIDAAGSLNTRWIGLWGGTTDHRFNDSGAATENGCLGRLRMNGTLEGVSKTNGVGGTTLTAASAALATGSAPELLVTKTTTDLIIARTDVAASITIPEARALRYLYLGNNGDSGGTDSGLRVSYNVERVA